MTERPLRATLWPVALLALAIGLVPLASAEVLNGHVVANSVSTEESVTQSGSLSLVHVGRQTGIGVPQVTVSGQSIQWTQADSSGTAIRIPSATGGSDMLVKTRGLTRSLGLSPDPAPQTMGQASFVVQSAQERFILHIYASSPLSMAATLDGVQLVPLQKPYLAKEEGVRETNQADPMTGTPPAHEFHAFSSSVPMVMASPRGASSLTLQGDFTVELWGLSGQLTGNGPSRELKSGTWTDPVSPGAPSDNVYNERNSFLRLRVQGGTATLQLPAEVTAQWAGAGSSITTNGAILLESPTGTLVTAQGQEVAVNSARHIVEGHHVLQMRAEPSGLDVRIIGLDENGNPIQPAGAMESLPAVVAGATAAVFGASLVALVAWLATRRLRRQPVLADVEAALEAGQYRRAARDAGRILARRPGLETALISRAIALSKAGRNRQVVAEVESHLEDGNPSDGVLHYVLGVAYADLGRPKDAESSFREAVRRTPDLHAAVQNRLPAGSRSPAPSTKSPAEPHGYA
jgi:hypothetical protein